eukprot:984643-Pleurochrysis_carterae.AAC.1
MRGDYGESVKQACEAARDGTRLAPDRKARAASAAQPARRRQRTKKASFTARKSSLSRMNDRGV